MHENMKRLTDEIKDLDYFLLLNPRNIFYMTDFYSDPHERFYALLMDVQKGTMTLFVPSLDVDKAKEYARVDNFITIADIDNGYEILSKHIGSTSIHLGVEKDYLTIKQYEQLIHYMPNATIKDVAENLIDLRLEKSRKEITAVKKAIHITETGLHNVLDNIKIGMTENEVKAMLEYELKVLGAESIAFDTMVLTGDNAALPHGESGKNIIEEGHFLLFDFGVYVDQYCSDITRTFIIGDPTEEQKIIYETVRSANEKAIEAVKMNEPIKNIDLAARKEIEKMGYGAYFTHRTGHGLGLEVHESPSIHKENDEIVQKGMLFTIEPGIYKLGPGGVRIEDNIYIHEDGSVEVLTTFPKTLMQIKR